MGKLARLALLLSLTPLPMALRAEGQVQQPPAGPSLTIVERDGIVPTAPDAGRYDFGEADPLVKPDLVRVFTLRNDAKSPITVSKMQVSCGCLKAEMAGGKPLPASIPPGSQVAVKVTMNLRGQPPIVLDKAVWLLPPNAYQPVATLQVVASVRPVIRFEPATIELGNIPAGQLQTTTLTVEMDPRLLVVPGPKLTSSNPDLSVQPFGADVRKENALGALVVVRTYAVTVSPKARLGAMLARLRMSLPNPSGKTPKPVHNRAAIAEVLRPIQVIARGDVIGSVSARPSSVFFGGVPQGEGSAQKVTLVGKSAAALANLKLSSTLKWVTATVRDATEDDILPSPPGIAPSNEPRKILEVKLDAAAPTGAQQGELNVVTASGERLVLPVVAYVMAKDSQTRSPPPRAIPRRAP